MSRSTSVPTLQCILRLGWAGIEAATLGFITDASAHAAVVEDDRVHELRTGAVEPDRFS